MKTKLPKLDTTKIVQVRLKDTQYYQEEFPKKQIVIHHTVSNGNAKMLSLGGEKHLLELALLSLLTEKE